MKLKIGFLKKYFFRFYNAGFIFRNTFIPLVVLTIYFISFSYIFPDGVNKVFVENLWKITLILTMVSGVVILTLIKFRKGDSLKKGYSPEKPSFSDSILILLPLTPIIQFILNNQNILSIWQSIYVVVFFAIFSILFIIIIPSIFGFIGSTRTIMILGLAFTFTIINMAALSNYFSWFEVGNLKIQLIIFGGIFLTIWLMYDLNYKKLIYVVIAIYFVSNTFSHAFNPINSTSSKESSITSNKLLALTTKREPLSTPNIYLFVYDAYVSNETMMEYGINNGMQEEYLRKSGFKLYPSTYSVGATTVNTMSRVLNASTQFYGGIKRAVSGEGITQNILKRFDYQTFGIFDTDYFFRGTYSTYDFSFPESGLPSTKLLSEAILTGEFRFNIKFDKFSRKQFLKAKENALEDRSSNPKFVYTHSNIPGHTQNSGSCLINETELFKERLRRANIEMKHDTETLAKIDPEAIIIIAGDHGPYLTKNCDATSPQYSATDINRLDLQDRFGTFLAIHWPTKDFEKYDDITVLQDLFPSIFAYLFKNGEILSTKLDPKTITHGKVTSGVSVNNGIIHGGTNDREPLFKTDASKNK